ncbi:MAG TPA: hypothetical protein VK162_25925, partial [Streptosporangiaceae bacterium]|nr:hypothetical protein [Streptosporangiaceae bacterium]
MRLSVKETAGVRQAQRWQQQLGEVPLETRRRHVPARGGQQHELLCFQAAGGEGERVERGGVQPLRVVSGHQQRPVVRQPGKQGEHGDPVSSASGGTGSSESAKAPRSASAWRAGRPATRSSTGRSSWCSPANARSCSDSRPAAASTRI